MTALPTELTFAHLDQDSDSVFQARADLLQMAVNINQIEAYLYNLFGFDGTKATAIATMFSGQAVLFPAGTRMYFLQATPPPGWVQMTFDVGRYLMAVPDDSGGNPVGNSTATMQTSAVSLIQQHLPNVDFFGYSDFQGDHSHIYTHTIVDYTGGSVSFERDANGPKAWARYESRGTNSGGIHQHNITVGSGGQGWPHDHMVNMSTYQPSGWRGIIGIKV